MQIDQTLFPKMQIIGFAKIDSPQVHEDVNGHDFTLQPGLYPIIYFELYSVQIAVQGIHDFLWVSREDFEWINIKPDMIKEYISGKEKRCEIYIS